MESGVSYRSNKTFHIIMIAIMTALTTVVTVSVAIPFPTSTGYLNFGDALVMISGMILGPFGGFFTGGVGSAFGDILLGYYHFVPITFMVKGIEGLIVGRASQLSRNKERLGVWDIIGLVLGSLAMLVGYLIAEIPLVGLEAALAELITVNSIQVIVGSIIAAIVGPRIRHFMQFQ